MKLKTAYIQMIYGAAASAACVLSQACTFDIVQGIPMPSRCYAMAIDSSDARLYVVAEDANQVVVVDTNSYASVGTLGIGAFGAGLVLDESLNRLFVAEQGSDLLRAIDQPSLSVLGAVGVGVDPVFGTTDPASHRVFYASHSSGTLSVVDGYSLSPLAEIGVGLRPVDAAFDSVTRRVFVSLQDGGGLRIVDADTLTVVGFVAVPGQPQSMAIDVNGRRLFVGSYNGGGGILSIVDLNSLIVTHSHYLTSYPAGIAFDEAKQQLMFATPEEDRVQVFGLANLSVNQSISIQNSPQRVVFDSVSRRLFVSIQDSNMVAVFAEPISQSQMAASADTYLKQGQPNQNQGAESFLQVRASGHNRALIAFDQAEIAATIGNCELTGAKLRVYIEFNADNWGDGREVAAHRMNQAWTELGATWNCPDDTNTGNQSPNGPTWNMQNSALWPFLSTPTDVVEHTNGLCGWIEFDVTADVQAFLDGSAANCGWLIKKVVEGQNGRVQYSSKEGANAPQLVLTTH